MIGQYIKQCGGPIFNGRCTQCGGVSISSSSVCGRYVPPVVRDGDKTIAVWSAEEIDRLRAENAELREQNAQLRKSWERWNMRWAYLKDRDSEWESLEELDRCVNSWLNHTKQGRSVMSEDRD